MAKELKFFDARELQKQFPDVRQFLIIGERSCGKTYSIKNLMLKDFHDKGRMSAYVRRSKECVKPSQMNLVFTDVIRDKWGELIGSEIECDTVKAEAYRGIIYQNGYLTDENGERDRMTHEPFCYYIPLSTWENNKGGSYEMPAHILYDECLTRELYLPDEIDRFLNVISTLVRTRSDCYVWCLGNTVSKLSPWDKFLGIRLGSLQHGESRKVKVAEDAETGEPIYWVVHRCRQYGQSSKLFGTGSSSSAMDMISSGSWQSEKYKICENLPNKKPAMEVHFTGECIDVWGYIWGDKWGIRLICFEKRQDAYSLGYTVTITDNPYSGYAENTFYRFNFENPKLNVIRTAVYGSRWEVDTADTGEMMRKITTW